MTLPASLAPQGPLPVATVADTLLDGHGILDTAGKRIFVAGAIDGERVRYRVRRRRRNYDEAELVEIIEPSPQRRVPVCPYFGTCGGCALQHLDGAAQLELKQASLLQALSRIGKVSPERLLAPLPGPAWGYRRRARLAVRFVEKKGTALVGFRERGRPYVMNMLSCETLHPEIAALIPALRSLVTGLSIRSRVPQVEAAVGGERTALVLRVLDPPSDEDAQRLLGFAREHAVDLYLQPGDESTVVPLPGGGATGTLSYTLPEFSLRFNFGPTDFIQVNASINQAMVRQALELLRPEAHEQALDLYCGIGNFSLPVAQRVRGVTGVEGAADALARARSNARDAGLHNARFVQADLQIDGAGSGAYAGRYDLAILDPPRTGAAALLPLLPSLGRPPLLYVSCHPGTLARDAGQLVTELGYRLEAAGVLDMFPQTSHVEAMALFLPA